MLPAVSYNSDLGFQYGGLVNLFHYGDGSRYPNYDHSFILKLRAIPRQWIVAFAYDSDQLIRGVRLSFDLSYMPEQAIDFLASMATKPYIMRIGLKTETRSIVRVCFTNTNAICCAYIPI